MLSMLRTLEARGDRRSHVLVYACSRWDRVAFRAEIDRLAATLSLRVIHVLEDPPPDWRGPTGYVTPAILLDALEGDGVRRHAFICGPDPMMSAVEAALVAGGVAESRIHLERFQGV